MTRPSVTAVVDVARHMCHRLLYRRRSRVVSEPVPALPYVHPTAQIGAASVAPEVRLGEHAKLLGHVTLIGQITVGRYTVINGPHTSILGRVNEVRIGAFCSIAEHVLVIEYGHPTDWCSTHFLLRHVLGEPRPDPVTSDGPIEVGNDVWIGAQSLVLPGASIGHGAVIGANSVVTSAIPPYAVAVGCPARVVRYRFEREIIARLLELRWWDWPVEQIRANRQLFVGTLSREKLDAVRE